MRNARRRRVSGFIAARRAPLSGVVRLRRRIEGEVRLGAAGGLVVTGHGAELVTRVVDGSNLVIGDFRAPDATPAGTLSAAASRGQTTITTTASGLAAGWYWLGYSSVNSGSGTRDCGGELVRVVSSAGFVATLDRAIQDDYGTGTTVRAVPANAVTTRLRIEGIRARGVRGVTAANVMFALASDVEVRHCNLFGSTVHSLNIRTSRGVRVGGVEIGECGTGVGNGYGVAPNQSSDVVIEDVVGINSRHVVSATSACPGVTVRRVWGHGVETVLDDHDGGRYWTVDDVRSTTGRAVFGNGAWTWEGRDMAISNCLFGGGLQLVHRRIRHTFTAVSTPHVSLWEGLNTLNGFAQLHQLVTFSGCSITGRNWHSIECGNGFPTGQVALDRVLFMGCNIVAGIPGDRTRHVVAVRRTSGTFTNYSLRIEGGTIAAGTVASGARVVWQEASGTSANLRVELANVPISTADNAGGANTVVALRNAELTSGTFTLAVQGSTYNGATMGAGNAGAGVSHSGAVTV